jgi:hypothetical protein
MMAREGLAEEEEEESEKSRFCISDRKIEIMHQ